MQGASQGSSGATAGNGTAYTYLTANGNVAAAATLGGNGAPLASPRVPVAATPWLQQ